MNGSAATALSALGADDPDEIANYRLLARLGEGGMGTVYLSRSRGGQPVALKLIRRDYARDEEFRRRFAQEVRAARRVRGYHLVPVVDHGTTGGTPWVASEFVAGVSLDKALAAHGPLPLPSVLHLVGCAARALTAVHAARVVHRDMKPGNIVLADSGPYVIDFGIARSADVARLTTTGGLIGTPQYMSPEHALGETVGPATDVFALGLIAAVAATGRHPYGDGGGMTVATRIASTSVRPPDLSAYPAELQPLLRACLTADPEERVTTERLASLCEEALGGRPLDDFTSWLPDAVTRDVEARARAVRNLPTPRTARTPQATKPPQAARAAKTAPAPGTSGSPSSRPVWPPLRNTPPPRKAATQRPPGKPEPRTEPEYRPAPTPDPDPFARPAVPPVAFGPGTLSRKVLLGFAAFVLTVWVGGGLVASIWEDLAPASGEDDSSDTAQVPDVDPARSVGTPESPKPSEKPEPKPEPSYAPLFTDRSFVIRDPYKDSEYAMVDFDEPKVAVRDAEDDRVYEIENYGDELEFFATAGRGAGKEPEECMEGVRSDALPSTMDEGQADDYLSTGTLLCMVTSEGNLAMLEITDLASTGSYTLPDISGRLTVWSVE